MPLQKQVIPIPFAQGIDTKSDPKQVMPGKLLSLFNGIFQSAKRILKRNGFASLSKNIVEGGAVTSGVGLKSYQSELDLITKDSFYSYSREANKWKGIRNGFPQVNVSAEEVVSDIDAIYVSDSTYHSAGYYGYAFLKNVNASSNHPLFLVVQDASTKTIVGTVPIDSTDTINTAPYVVSVGNYIVVIYLNKTIGQLRYVAFNVTTLTAGSPVTITSDLSQPLFDVTVINNYIYLAYFGPGQTAAYFISPTLVISAQTIIFTPQPSGGLAIFGDASNNVWAAYVNKAIPQMEVAVFTEFFAAPILPPTVVSTNGNLADSVNVAAAVNGTDAIIYTSINAGNPLDAANQFIGKVTVNISGSAGPFGTLVRSTFIFAKPFLHDGTIFLPTVYTFPYVVPPNDVGIPSPLQPTIFVMNEAGFSIAKILSLNVQFNDPTNLDSSIFVMHTNLISADVFQMSPLRSAVIGEGGDGGHGYTLIGDSIINSKITFYGFIDTASLANALLLSGGDLYTYDGSSLVEQGFDLFPDYLSLQDFSTGALSAGQYQYAAIYEWVDAKGNHYRSAPSPIFSITVAAGREIKILVPMLRITARTDVTIGLYRTSANGSTLRRIFPRPNSNSIFNDKSQNQVTITDNVPDSDQAFGDILYTTGGEVENIAAPASNIITTYRSRLILAPSETANQIWYSKEVVPGFPVETSDLFTQNIDELGGNITALIQMDDKLIIFKNKNIFYMTGQGPAPSGANNDFSTPLLVNSDVGCVNQQSLVLMPNGVMFKSQKGIYLLDRSLSCSYIGAEVEAYNSSNITSAVLMATVNQVRFTLDSGVALVYDYYFQQWSVFNNIAAVDSCLFEGNHTFLKSDGTTLEETPGVYNDDGSFIQLSAITAWLSFASIQGFQRIYKALLLGDKKGSHTLVVKVRRDFDPTIIQTDNIDATLINPAVYQWRIFPIIQKCEAMQFEISDSQSSAFNEGLDISDLTLEVGTKSGAFKLPASQSAG